MSQSSRNIVILVAVALAVLGGAYYYYFYRLNPPAEIHRFVGDVVSASGDVIILDGVYYDPEKKLPQSMQTSREFQFKVNESTIFWRTYIHRPSPEEVMAMGGTYFIDDLPKEEGFGSIRDLGESMKLGSVYVEAEFPSSILTAKDPVASHIVYRIFPRPVTPQFTE